MTIRIAINGFGRIGRNVLRALYENNYRSQLQVVAINDLGDAETNAHLLKYDSVHGRFEADVSHDSESLTVNGDRIAITALRNPEELPWKDHRVDVVFECTGLFTKRDKAAAHLKAGARKVIISAPSPDADAMIVYGVNHETLTTNHDIISNASCTTNCLAPVVEALHKAIGIESGLMTTIHSYTNDQKLSDVYHSDLYRARSATQSMIPTKTGAAAAIGKVIPELEGKLDGLAVRVPTINVSLVDFGFIASRETTVDEVNEAIKTAAEKNPVLGYNTEKLVSIDFNHNALSSIYDANHTRVLGRHVKVMAWYDNEWGFSNRMLDNALALFEAGQ
ncbi:glyceraldehyde 3-phosphate dehydrogenase [Marinobacter sp. DSM 26671]|jgi:glyceraldehyde 3-phosphate dehydrogenase|uniref:type I glyceraldehyde-3-phosphate dehydrogenase n=1 Tax=Marinobacter sp. DSM 26671 TaxID=1761793 RepID=UPI0008E64B83|nr:type I glyceraldehyde-3-phosphate dehydrogenase [Marinobacter sp. DSM 26671]MCP4063314.1 type I glyceraldehyde-3-phosphate dehydrogenase [Gammaproteobacteria bacterium]MEC7729110.1 type I glyceraldehyde-3-phosphate dehydrogenase [Pseudomonadota bacterium]MTI76878.1 type I glyceraldehyde-3-phosphate dehydrogenase [Marinobacter sp.]PTB99996.1 type I glyceraldehyde-3-phosphate dehydrogenase [Marinobacter sp. Z-F4-2]PHS48368.1 MAG: type I glyceraldehyde-3-phosphate dehydrogenase [Marinobacter s|tara:strand:+ start:22 stop:1026 length:1005 start_codon:yes stop_codon:yes gene_type:complete